MPDNITRDTFDPTKGYTSVRMQQGRLQLDSDWNEQADIQNYLRRAQVVDMIGAGSGASKVDPITGQFSEQSFQLRKIATPPLADELTTFNLKLAAHESADLLPTEADKYKQLIYVAKIQDAYYLRIFNQDGKLIIPDPEFITNEKLRQELDEALKRKGLSRIHQYHLIDKLFPPEATDIAILPGHFYAQGVLCTLVPSSTIGVKRIPNKPNQLQVSPSLTLDGRRLKVGDWLILEDQSFETIKLFSADINNPTTRSEEGQAPGEPQDSTTDNPQPGVSAETQKVEEVQALATDRPSAAPAAPAVNNQATNHQLNPDPPANPANPPTLPTLPGWRITKIVDAKTFTIEVAGNLSFITETARMRRIVTYTSQPDWPVEFPSNSTTPISQKQGRYFAYLDVWQRHITAVDDPAIREIALNGPDTTTRTKTVWQLKLRAAKEQNGQDLPDKGFKVPIATGEELSPEWQTFESEERQRSPKLNACARLCDNGNGVTSNGRLGNFLYRVEIHRGNDPQAVNNNPLQSAGNSDQQQPVTFKWSRDNASVTSSVQSIDGNVIRIAKSSQNAWADSKPDQWLELLTEAQELRGEPGILVPLKSITDNKLEFNAARIIGGAIPHNVSKVRRWDHTESDAPQGAIPIRDQWVELENGIKVLFEISPKETATQEPIIYRTGDYWLIPSRAVINDIEWPTDRADDDVSNQVKSVSKPLPQPRKGVNHQYALLGIVDINNENRISQIFDQRILFPPLLRALDKGGDTISGNLDVRGKIRTADLDVTGQFSSETFRGETFEVWRNPTDNDSLRYGKIQAVQIDNAQPTDLKQIQFVAESGTSFSFLGGKVEIGQTDAKQNLEVVGTISGQEILKQGQAVARQRDLEAHISNQANPHSVTAEQVDGSNHALIDRINHPVNATQRIDESRIDTDIARLNQVTAERVDGSNHALIDRINNVVNDGQRIDESRIDTDIARLNQVTAERVDGSNHALIDRINHPDNAGQRIDESRIDADIARLNQVTAERVDGSNHALIDRINHADNAGQRIDESRIDVDIARLNQVTAERVDGSNHALIDRINHVVNDGQRIDKSRIDADIARLNQVTAERVDGSIHALIDRINHADNAGQRINKNRIDTDIARLDNVLTLAGGTITGNLSVNGTITSEGRISAKVATINNIQSGDYVQFSSASLKEDIVELTGQEAATVLGQLRPVQFRYRDDIDGSLRAGFIAEETHHLLTSSDKKAIRILDIVAVLTKAVKDSQTTAIQLAELLETQRHELAALAEKVRELEAQKEHDSAANQVLHSRDIYPNWRSQPLINQNLGDSRPSGRRSLYSRLKQFFRRLLGGRRNFS